MAENRKTGATPWLAFLLGGLIVVLAALGYFLYSGGGPTEPELPTSINVDINVPKVPPIPDGPRLPDAPIPVPK